MCRISSYLFLAPSGELSCLIFIQQCDVIYHETLDNSSFNSGRVLTHQKYLSHYRTKQVFFFYHNWIILLIGCIKGGENGCLSLCSYVVKLFLCIFQSKHHLTQSDKDEHCSGKLETGSSRNWFQTGQMRGVSRTITRNIYVGYIIYAKMFFSFLWAKGRMFFVFVLFCFVSQQISLKNTGNLEKQLHSVVSQGAINSQEDSTH